MKNRYVDDIMMDEVKQRQDRRVKQEVGIIMGKADKASQKLRLMYLAKILLEETDDEHKLTHAELDEKLEQYGFKKTDRGTFMDDMDQLSKYGNRIPSLKVNGKEIPVGFEIEQEKEGREYKYHIISRTFELAELKIIIDSVQSSRFISENRSRELIEKLKTLLGRYEADSINRQVYVAERIKSDNKKNFCNVDRINKAISDKKKISFLYFEYDVKRKRKGTEKNTDQFSIEKVYRHNRKLYIVNPWNLMSHNQNYYLVGCESDGKIKHFRVDRMDKVEVTDEKMNSAYFRNLKISDYADKRFNMYDGPEECVKLIIEDKMYKIIADRFGQNIEVGIADDKHLWVKVNICISYQFLAWILALGDAVRIEGPESVIDSMKKMLKEGISLYGK